MPPRDPATTNVMVAGAQSMGALGAIRSLGRAGYRVHAVSPTERAIGLHSNFATRHEVHPPVTAPTFGPWLTDYIDSHKIEMILPGGGIAPEGHPAVAPFGNLFPVSQDSTVRRRSSKYGLFDRLMSGEAQHKANLPPTLLVDFDQGLPSASDLAALGRPLFIKCDGLFARSDDGDDRVLRLEDPETALARLKELGESYSKAVVQGFAPGVGVGAFFLRWNDRIRARFMHRRLHEMPHTGGASSLRESWRHEAILKDAEAKLDRAGWQGVAMVEYRWDPASDSFSLMEMNLRFWGSLHLALYAGIDFPKYLAQCHFGETPQAPESYPIGLKCRNTVPFEFGYLVSLWRDGNVAFSRKLYSLLEAGILTLDPRVKNDLFFPGDRGLYWRRWMQFIRHRN